jgi:uncharacterized membrane protein
MHPYEIVELKVPSSFDRGLPAAINQKGVIVGRAVKDDTTTQAVRWVSATNPILLSQPTKWTASAAYGLNDIGDIVGVAMVNQLGHGALWKSGNAKLLQWHPRGSVAKAINNSGIVVGECDLTPCRWVNFALEGTDGNAFVTNQRGELLAIDNAGRTYGENYGRATRWDVTGYQFDLSPNRSGVLGANDYELAVGYEFVDGSTEARYWSPTAAGALNPLQVGSVAFDVNNLGQVAGQSGLKAALWTGPIITILEDLIDPTLGWSLARAESINDAGMIVGYGWLGGEIKGWLMAPRRNIKRAPPPIFWHILFGVVHDGPGVVIGPRQKPVPIPPWNPLLKQIPSTYRNLIEGLLKQPH